MNLSELFDYVSADAKGGNSAPTAGGTEWTQWLNWTNEELYSFGEVHDWPELSILNYSSSADVSSTSLALPSNFKKMVGHLVVGGSFYNEVDRDQFDLQNSSSKAFRTGYDGGWFVEWKGPITSATSVIIPLQIYPTALATTTDQIIMRNPIYLAKRLKTRVFKYRQDPVFTEMESEANLMLQQMLENEYYKHQQYKGGATTREQEVGFILGVD